MNYLTKKEILFMGFMLFSMLFGAGNLIFPAYLGQTAGENVWQAVAGFIISDAGLAVLAFIAIAKSGSFDTLVNRVNPIFALLFPLAIYLSIGPGLAIPRAGSLAYEMSIKPFLPNTIESSPFGLIIYTIVFFSIVYWFAKSPSKLIDRFGKILTPSLLILIIIVFIKALFTDLSSFNEATILYEDHPISQGFLDGYQTMDAIAALIYGIVFVNIFKAKEINHKKLQVQYLALFGIICAILLTCTYLIIAYLGASTDISGTVENGAIVLSTVMNQLFGNFGTIVLGLIFTLACLSVCIGLITSCAQYFASIFSKLSYLNWVVFLCAISAFVANLGLTQILKVSVPVLGLLYPMAIALIVLGLIHDKISFNHRSVYVMTIGFVGLYSFIEMVNHTFLNGVLSEALANIPMQKTGFGWVLPGFIGFLIGAIMKNKDSSKPKFKHIA